VHESEGRVQFRLRAIPLFSFVLLFPGLRLNAREMPERGGDERKKDEQNSTCTGGTTRAISRAFSPGNNKTKENRGIARSLSAI
jgi:hypothetical protein